MRGIELDGLDDAVGGEMAAMRSCRRLMDGLMVAGVDVGLRALRGLRGRHIALRVFGVRVGRDEPCQA